jgi:DNA-3-methyladenine glycosylase II
MPRFTYAGITAEIAARDRALARVIEEVGTFRLGRSTGDPFAALAESILYQQLAGRAAAAIHGRFVALFDGKLTPESVLRLPEAALRGAGLSGAKAASIRDLAAKATDGTVPLHDLRRLSDDDIVTRLSLVRGIGRWTAEMFLIFELHRLDVWPVDDYGVRNGWALAHDLPALPTPKALQQDGERFRPYRTAAAWYCWRAVHLSRGGGGGRAVSKPALRPGT